MKIINLSSKEKDPKKKNISLSNLENNDINIIKKENGKTTQKSIK